MALGYVRPARESDAAEIARIQLTTWRNAYQGIVPASALDALETEWVRAQWVAACANPPSPAHRVFVAVEQQEDDPDIRRTVGFAAVGPDDEDEEEGDDVALITELLVEPRFGRRGHGSRLLSAVVTHWREHGFRLAHAWAFPRDSASLGFYKSAGWDSDGTRRTLDMDNQPVAQMRLHVDITETNPSGT